MPHWIRISDRVIGPETSFAGTYNLQITLDLREIGDMDPREEGEKGAGVSIGGSAPSRFFGLFDWGKPKEVVSRFCCPPSIPGFGLFS